MDSSGYERRAVWQSSQDEDGGVKWSYQPHRVTNIFFNDTDVKNNPLFGLMNITVDLVNERKIPQRKAIREVLYNGSNTLDQVRERLRSDPKYWTYNGLRSAFFVGQGLLAMNQNKVNAFMVEAEMDERRDDGTDTTEKASEDEKRKTEK